MVTIVDSGLRLSFYTGVVTPEQAQEIASIIETCVPWRNAITPGRRVNQIYGNPGFILKSAYGGYPGKPLVESYRPALSWDQLPLLIPLRDLLTRLTGETYKSCIIQRYPSGRVGIKPHRDKGLSIGSTICGFSFGATRMLVMRRYGHEPITIPLYPGSLYILHPPTNDHWTHSIDLDDTTEPRYSLTFRNGD